MRTADKGCERGRTSFKGGWDRTVSYGRYGGSPSRAELEKAFFLDDANKALIARCRGDNRLGFSLQMTTIAPPADADNDRHIRAGLAGPIVVGSGLLKMLTEVIELGASADAAPVLAAIRRMPALLASRLHVGASRDNAPPASCPALDPAEPVVSPM